MNVFLSPFFGVGYQAFNNSGVPLAGGYIYTYLAGTTTPATTYTTASALVANANPIVLDSGGRTPQAIWLDATKSYKFAFTDSVGNPVGYTVDNVTGLNNTATVNTGSMSKENFSGTGAQVAYTLTYYPGDVGQALEVYISGVYQQTGSWTVSGQVLTFSTAPPLGTNNIEVVNIGIATLSGIASSLVTYLPAGTNAVVTTVQTKLRQSVSVLDFGADPTGAADSTTAIQAAYAAVQASAQSATGTVTTATTKYSVFYPKGIYKVSGTISSGGSVISYGDRAIIQATAGTNVFLSTGYQDTFRGLTIVGGAKAISFVTSNVDTCTTLIDRCEFQQQTTSVFDTDSNSSSTTIKVDNCKINNNNAGCVIGQFITGDKITFGSGNWIEVASTSVFVIGTAGNTSTGAVLELDGVFFVPYSGVGTWITLNESSSLFATNGCRFGGENGGATNIVLTRQIASSSVPKSLVIQNCTTYSSDAAIAFYGIPNVVVWKGNAGQTVPSNGLYFDTSITSANLAQLSQSQTVWDVEQNGTPQFKLSGTNVTAMQYAYATSKQKVAASTLLSADKILQIPLSTGAFTPVNVTVGCTTSNSTNSFGAFAFQVTASSTPTTDVFNQSYTTALNGITAGLYTAVFDFENVTGYPIVVTMNTSATTNRVTLLKGKSIICVPFYWDGTSSQKLGIGCGFNVASQVVKISSIRLFAGNIDINTQNTTMYGTAAPAGSLQAEVADTVIQQTPAVGSPKSWVCTVKGAPGTWVSTGNL